MVTVTKCREFLLHVLSGNLASADAFGLTAWKDEFTGEDTVDIEEDDCCGCVSGVGGGRSLVLRSRPLSLPS